MNNSKLNAELLKNLVESAAINQEGRIADYIPELLHANKNLAALAVQELGGESLSYSNYPIEPVTLQSTSKLVPLIGLLEECGIEKLLNWVKMEPSGDEFSSVIRLEQFGPKPSNPMLNAGAITLCSHIPGAEEQKITWVEFWVRKLFNMHLNLNPLVFSSEKRTGDRNRSLAYLLKSRNNLGSDVNETLDLYFALCSYEATIDQMLYLPLILANQGRDPETNQQIISEETCKITLSIMATCGLYDETGTYMVKTGMPAKSGVSGYIVAVIPRKAAAVALSPLVSTKGNSIRGEIMLEGLSRAMNWHFSIP